LLIKVLNIVFCSLLLHAHSTLLRLEDKRRACAGVLKTKVRTHGEHEEQKLEGEAEMLFAAVVAVSGQFASAAAKSAGKRRGRARSAYARARLVTLPRWRRFWPPANRK
jgi:hypothetical protein